MEAVKIGQLITEPQQRDAIHVAIAPVVASELLCPGDHVGFVAEGDTSQVGKCEKRIGIVDPFLDKTVEKGQSFYLFLYPNSVIGLRHDWKHPAFREEQQHGISQSEMWLRVYAAKMNPYEPAEEAFATLIEGLQSGELFAHGTDCHGLYDVDDQSELKEHAEKYLGITIDWGRFTFSCSC